MKRHVLQFFYCRVCIRCRGNVFTESLPSNDKGSGSDTQTHRQQGDITSLILFFRYRESRLNVFFGSVLIFDINLLFLF
jgi:hypothetical protein